MKRIMLIGDLIIDESIEVTAAGQSAEGLVTHEVVRRLRTVGGIGNVAKHIVRLGGRVELIHQGPFVSFNELDNQEALRITQIPGGDLAYPIKQRFFCGGEKVFKVNTLTKTTPFHRDLLPELERFRPDLVIAADNGCEFLHGAEAAIVDACRRFGCPLYLDVQFSRDGCTDSIEVWHGVDSIFMNEVEAYKYRCQWNRQDFFSGKVHIKMGHLGSRTVDGDYIDYYPARDVKVVDTVGAGDAYIAAFSMTDSPWFANQYAGLTCTKLGTELPTREEINEIAPA